MCNNGVVESAAVGRDVESRDRRFRLAESDPRRKREAENETCDRACLVARRDEHAERVQT